MWDGFVPGGDRMLGWHISVYRQADGGASPATAESVRGERVAVWQTGLGGLDWVYELVEAGRALHLGDNGYPYWYTATAENLIPRIEAGPPEANLVWRYDEGDILTDKWEGKTVIDRAATAACRPDEWMLIEAWDES
jgi:hypothetical protein